MYNDNYRFKAYENRIKESYKTKKGYKTALKEFHVYVNWKTREILENVCSSLLEWEGIHAPKNMNGYAIKYYLKHYKKINKGMSDIFRGFIYNFTKTEKTISTTF